MNVISTKTRNTSSARRIFTRITLSLFAISLASSIGIGWAGYRFSRARILGIVVDQNLKTSQSLVAMTAASGKADKEAEEAINTAVRIWSETSPPVQGSYMCILQNPGVVVYHSKVAGMQGRDVSSVSVTGPDGQGHTVASLLENKESVGGINTNLRGVRQLVGYAYSDSINGLIVTHIPVAVLDDQIKSTIAPWAVVLGFLSFVLIPGTVYSIYHASCRSLDRCEKALDALRGSQIALEDNNTELTQTYQHIPTGLCQFDSDFTIVRANETAEEILGDGDGSVIGQNARDVFAGFLPDPMVILETALKDGQIVEKLSIRSKRPNASHRQYVLSAKSYLLGHSGARKTNVLVEDVTEAREQEQAIENLSKVFTDSTEAIFLHDSDCTVIEANRAAESLCGITKSEMVGQDLKDLFSSVEDDRIDNLVQALLHGKKIRNMEGWTATKTPKGSIPVMLSMAKLSSPPGHLPLVATIVVDISPRKRAESALEASLRALACFGRITSDVIVRLDAEGAIKSVNEAAKNTFGYTEEVLHGRDMSMLFPPNEFEQIALLLQKKSHASKPSEILCSNLEVIGRGKDGSLFPISIAMSYIGLDSSYICTIRDISEVKRLERAVYEAAFEEQRRIGQEMHDSVQQHLIGLLLMGSSLLKNLENQSFDKSKLAVQSMVRALSSTIDEVRDICRDLVHTKLEHDGVRQSLTELADSTQTIHGVCCRFVETGDVDEIPLSTSVHLLRIAQEGVTNALKHGKATEIEIRVEVSDRCTRMEVWNNGRPIEQVTNEQGIGLKTMWHRADLIDGTISLRSKASSGTIVCCEIPKT